MCVSAHRPLFFSITCPFSASSLAEIPALTSFPPLPRGPLPALPQVLVPLLPPPSPSVEEVVAGGPSRSEKLVLALFCFVGSGTGRDRLVKSGRNCGLLAFSMICSVYMTGPVDDTVEAIGVRLAVA
ncbi:hypothetical protein AXG93_2255s1010 [Marchantia polymorpha subsp. ruderalis]|uniref:Uncharacterized protein n=1 Tax=Marchantia polymorpha subsp. ruderalis TaxID=1480154 RepID=A0A176W7B6_MARPO|nr:hypothetical protein AXG93_2255s1010 [Marchantia polymorpha subsp. ruderalis]